MYIRTKPSNFFDFFVRTNIAITEPEKITSFQNGYAGFGLILWFYFYSLFICFFYTSTLLAIIVAHEYERPINYAQDALDRGAHVHLPHFLTVSRPDYSYFHLSPEEIQAVTLMSIRQGNIFNYFDWGSETPKFVLEDARATGAVYLASGVKTASSKMYSSKAKGMHVSEQGTEYGLQLTFLLPKYAPWLPRVSQVMSWVVDSGIIDKFARVDKPPKPQDMGPIRISLDHMTALLILLAVGYFCAILCFLLELR
eukprot:maker-scaffold1299_size49759-snap-gene-0.13 protein:Tk03390 transcript:maker-scaffold1299_size49759-snap-gene-0.13-mRNA-1 annotation:"hypothetical protein L798_03054"